jgi:hypothetical protein
VYIVPCGHAFAGSVVKEVAGSACLQVCFVELRLWGWRWMLMVTQCNESYAENDVIPILPTLPTDIARLNLRMKTLREKSLTHALKKAPGSKKRKKGADEDKKKASDEEKANKAQSSDNGIKNASTASLTQKVMKEQEERNKRRKMAENANVKSLFNKSDHRPDMMKSADYMTRGFSIGKK